MKKCLLLFTIGPVQSFIAQARKIKDLFFGSYILSYLCKSAINYLKELNSSVEVIFPNEKTLGEIKLNEPNNNKKNNSPTIPNRFLVSISIENKEKVEEIAKELEIKVRQKFREFCPEFNDSNLKEEYDKQIDDFLEIYWAAVEDNNDYKNNYELLEKTIGAIKNTRTFKQFNPISGLRKCSICGQRNALVRNKNNLQNNEELCAICWTKRNYNFRENVPSTAKIAVLDDINKIKSDSKGYKLYNSFKNSLGSIYDEELLFEENLTKNYFLKNNIYGPILDIAKEKYQDLKNYTKENQINFTKYYALIALDGDDMGKWVSGEKLKDKDINLRKFHKTMSEKLVEYNKKVRDIIDEAKGYIIYSGGDDILAFINLNYLFEVLKNLRTEFPQFADDIISTASCGVCIAHYKTPLHSVIKWAHKAEKWAKEVKNKDAFSIVVYRRSGNITQTTLKWYKNQLYAVDIMQKILDLLNNNIISSSFINKLQEEFRFFEKIPHSILKTEIRRLVKRSCICDKNEKKKYSELMSEKLIELFEFLPEYKLINFFSALNLIDFLNRRGGKND